VTATAAAMSTAAASFGSLRSPRKAAVWKTGQLHYRCKQFQQPI